MRPGRTSLLSFLPAALRDLSRRHGPPLSTNGSLGRARPIHLVFAALLALGASDGSCNYGPQYRVTYRIEVIPAGAGLERRVTMYRTMSTDTAEILVPLIVEVEVADRFERTYGIRPSTAWPDSPVTDSDFRYVARQRFAFLPNDVGNGGKFRAFESPLGRNWIYAERIRGAPEPPAKLQAYLGAADSLADILLGWTGSELGRHAGWPAFRAYLDGDLRRMLRGFAFRFWACDSLEDQELADDRVTVAFYEYPLLSWMAGVTLANSELDDRGQEDSWMFRESEDAIAGIMGLPRAAGADSVLDSICDPNSGNLRLVRYVASKTGETTEEAGQRLLRITCFVLGIGSPEDEGPGGWDSVAVQLTLPEAPVGMETNGDWDPERRMVVWTARISKPGGGYPRDPLSCIATWGSPDTVVQRRLFGRVALREETLAAYNSWFSTLEPAQQKEWNRMLTRLRPGKLGPLRTFEFSEAMSRRKSGEDIPGRKLLLDRLE